ncbi:hypothetical protein GA0116948_11928 [Chitinophaga costaii]|uniref:Uncharacterized protein n=1 Tax=Chitinophaga costaii TaxID=1335309 RepID=A0A1C4G0Q7_9BACT|nr:hypothetical protein [Chitinophaga costaii]PUZ19957.1 hypothetical protein DCM91_19895 [Chitinophaga costaii]SCC61726.1 hypothetical protein GA0116948_11928 [Chitinophaga costaii]
MQVIAPFYHRLLAAALLATPLSTFAQKADAPNTWAASPVKADGRLDEWKNPLPHYNSDTRLFYDISNDGTNLYIAISSRDEITQYRIINAGLHVTINTAGKSKNGPGVTFPVIDQDALYDYRHTPALNYTPSPQEKAAQQKLLFLHTSDISVNGLKNVKDGNIPMQNEFGIQAAISNDNTGMLSMEIIIPLSRLEFPEENEDKVVAFNFRLNKIDKKEAEKLKAESDKAAQAGGSSSGTPGPGSGYFNYVLGFESAFWTRQSLAKKI